MTPMCISADHVTFTQQRPTRHAIGHFGDNHYIYIKLNQFTIYCFEYAQNYTLQLCDPMYSHFKKFT